MTYRITIDLSARDLRHFRRELRRARESVSIADDEEILTAASELVRTMRASDLPDFVTERIEKLETLIAMLTDADWKLDDDERSPVLAALAYVCDPEDIIPDDIPGLGLLDDAVMIELVFRELRHELAAYEDFCKYRKSLRGRGVLRLDAAKRAEKLAKKAQQLVERMHRRRREERTR